eukprot:915127-Rhodomonas_salina.1
MFNVLEKRSVTPILSPAWHFSMSHRSNRSTPPPTANSLHASSSAPSPRARGGGTATARCSLACCGPVLPATPAPTPVPEKVG